MASYFIGVDVGTGSARAGVFDLNGHMVGQASRTIDLYRPKADFVEQSSDNIWRTDVQRGARCGPYRPTSTRFRLKEWVLTPPVLWWCWTRGPTADRQPVRPHRAEHHRVDGSRCRAITQAERINATKHRVLDFVGGIISPGNADPQNAVVETAYADHLGQCRLPV